MGVWLLVAGSIACGGLRKAGVSRPVKPGALRQPPQVEDLELKALLLLQVDRQIFEPFTVEQALKGSPELRRYLALCLGRSGSRRAEPVLQALVLDDDAAVRRTAVYSLGLVGSSESRALLLRTAKGPDGVTARTAVEALARLGTPVLDVGEALSELPEDELWRRLLPSLFRFEDPATVPLALRSLPRSLTPQLRSWAVFALSRRAAPELRETFRALLTEEDTWTRALAARALGSLATAADFPSLKPLLEDPSPEVILAVLESVPPRLAAGVAAPPWDWREGLLQRLEDPRPSVRLAAVKAAGEWLLDEELGAALEGTAREGREPFASAAVLSLVEGRDPRAPELVARLAASSSSQERRRAVQGAASLGLWELIRQLAEDPEGPVRAGASRILLTRSALRGEEAAIQELLQKAAADPDAGVRASLLEYLVGDPRVPISELLPLVARSRRDRITASGINGVRALVARAEAEPSERELAIRALRGLATDREYLVRIQVSLGLRQLGADATPVGPATAGRNVQAYQDLILRAAAPRRARLVTSRGSLTLELDCPDTPLTCTNFLQLAEQGFYDGLSFHDVRPGSYVQGGDPRGDGWGGPGYTVRDEPRAAVFDRGSLGMARQGRHSGGSQFFLALARAPELDGVFTQFGRVVDGLEVLDLLMEGDLVERAEVLP
ncbi:MAG: peptidylprolyl isomerase [Acidobacteria bacterium]|nr:peptidylprolyl isomerase [Acidobacteriota bacterium]